MSRHTRDQDTKTAKLAAPFRTLLKALIRERIKTQSDKQALAEFLGRSLSFVNQMTYHGEGSLDAWIGAFVFAYQLDVGTLAQFFARQGETARKISPLSRADQLWFSLDEFLSDDQKYYWVSLMQAAINLETELGIEPRVRRKKPKRLQAAEKAPWPKK